MKPVSTKLKEQPTVIFVEAAGGAVILCRGQLVRGRMDVNTTPQLSALEGQLPASAVTSSLKVNTVGANTTSLPRSPGWSLGQFRLRQNFLWRALLRAHMYNRHAHSALSPEEEEVFLDFTVILQFRSTQRWKPLAIHTEN